MFGTKKSVTDRIQLEKESRISVTDKACGINGKENYRKKETTSPFTLKPH
jgi:hypothetical protein